LTTDNLRELMMRIFCGGFRRQATWKIIPAVCLFLFGCGYVAATGLNAELTLSEPDGDYFEAGDVFTATLILTDDDEDTLYVDEVEQNGFRTVQLWVSGPRHDFHGVEPYVNYQIVSYGEGYDEDAGFDPETGEIEINLPDGVDWSGTATILFKVQRVVNNIWYSRYPQVDIQFNQVRPTFTKSLRYLSCTNCHDNISHHGTSNLGDCVVCHTHDYDESFDSFVHVIHHDEHENTCHECHRANGGIDNYGRTPCFSCHRAPDNHQNYNDNGCSHCHTGNNSVFNRHDEYTPDEPDNFDLLEPEDDAVIDTLSVELSWEESDDNDNNDILWYEVELALDEDFRDVRILNVEDNTSLTIDDLENGETYWWRVRAADLNTDGTYSEERQFEVNIQGQEPPSAFSLLLPEDGSDFFEEGYNSLEIEHIWSTSFDPNPEDEVTYTAYFHINEFSPLDDTLLVYSSLVETMLVVNLFDTLLLYQYDFIEYFDVSWKIEAVSQGDTVACDTPFTYSVFAITDVGEIDLLPENYTVSNPYPNPFNPEVKIVVGLPIKSDLSFKVYNISGQLVGTMADGNYSSGFHTLLFNGENLSSGVYFIRYQVADQVEGVRKILLVR